MSERSHEIGLRTRPDTRSARARGSLPGSVSCAGSCCCARMQNRPEIWPSRSDSARLHLSGVGIAAPGSAREGAVCLLDGGVRADSQHGLIPPARRQQRLLGQNFLLSHDVAPSLKLCVNRCWDPPPEGCLC
eukprot:2967716-Rhodomonas_salina.2